MRYMLKMSYQNYAQVDIQTLATTINYRALTTLIMFVSHFYKKTEECTMGGLFSVIFIYI